MSNNRDKSDSDDGSGTEAGKFIQRYLLEFQELVSVNDDRLQNLLTSGWSEAIRDPISDLIVRLVVRAYFPYKYYKNGGEPALPALGRCLGIKCEPNVNDYTNLRRYYQGGTKKATIRSKIWSDIIQGDRYSYVSETRKLARELCIGLIAPSDPPPLPRPTSDIEALIAGMDKLCSVDQIAVQRIMDAFVGQQEFQYYTLYKRAVDPMYYNRIVRSSIVIHRNRRVQEEQQEQDVEAQGNKILTTITPDGDRPMYKNLEEKYDGFLTLKDNVVVLVLSQTLTGSLKMIWFTVVRSPHGEAQIATGYSSETCPPGDAANNHFTSNVYMVRGETFPHMVRKDASVVPEEITEWLFGDGDPINGRRI